MFSCYLNLPRPIFIILHHQESQKAAKIPSLLERSWLELVGCRVSSWDSPMVGGSCTSGLVCLGKEQQRRFIPRELSSSQSPAALSSWEYLRIEADSLVWEKGVVCHSPAVHQLFSVQEAELTLGGCSIFVQRIFCGQHILHGVSDAVPGVTQLLPFIHIHSETVSWCSFLYFKSLLLHS